MIIKWHKNEIKSIIKNKKITVKKILKTDPNGMNFLSTFSPHKFYPNAEKWN